MDYRFYSFFFAMLFVLDVLVELLFDLVVLGRCIPQLRLVVENNLHKTYAFVLLLAFKNCTIRFFSIKTTSYNTEINYRTSKQEITTHQNKIQNFHKSRRCHKLNFD
jgi:hypothetical protein